MKKHPNPHRYRRTKVSPNYFVYKCTIKGCTHYQGEALMTAGTEFTCYECTNTAVIESKEDLIGQLRCKDCRKKATILAEQVLEALEKLNG